MRAGEVEAAKGIYTAVKVFFTAAESIFTAFKSVSTAAESIFTAFKSIFTAVESIFTAGESVFTAANGLFTKVKARPKASWRLPARTRVDDGAFVALFVHGTDAEEEIVL